MLRKGRKVTLDELIEACNDALYETNDYGEVSRRTIQHYIQEQDGLPESGGDFHTTYMRTHAVSRKTRSCEYLQKAKD